MQMEVEQLASLALKRKRARGKLHAFPSVQFKMRASKQGVRRHRGGGKGPQGCQMAKFDPFLSLDCARVEGVGRNPRKGRDQILPSGNLDSQGRAAKDAGSKDVWMDARSVSLIFLPLTLFLAY